MNFNVGLHFNYLIGSLFYIDYLHAVYEDVQAEIHSFTLPQIILITSIQFTESIHKLIHASKPIGIVSKSISL